MDQEEVLLKTGETLIIRHAKPSDAPDMNAYLRIVADETTFLSFDSSEWTKSDEEEAAIVQEHIDTVNKVFYLALIDGRIVAMINAGGTHKKRLRHSVEFGISVLKEHWQKGIGTILVNKVIDWAKKNPVVKKVNLMVSSHNPRAIAMYERMGFEHQGTIYKDNFVNGEYMDGYSMGMWLG